MIRKPLQMVALAAIGCLLSLPATADAAVFKLFAKLNANEADPTASGRVTWELDTNDGSMRLDVDLDGITVDDEVTVLINWRAVAMVQLVDGRASIHLDTEDGDFVFRAKDGHNVTIFSPLCWVVLDGTLKKP